MSKIIAERYEFWDGKAQMKVVYNDGGRAAAGRKGEAGDCVVRAIAIATETPCQKVYNDLFKINKDFASNSRSRVAAQVKKSGGTPRNGNFKEVYRPYLKSLGWDWVPTMAIGSGCKVHLCEGELPTGRIIARVRKHLVAVIDDVIHDIFNPQRITVITENGKQRIAHRCVYGYFIKKD